MADRNHRDPLAGVGPEDALSVLRQLLARRPELGADLAAILGARAAMIDRDDVAEVLTDALQSVRIEDVWAQSGRTPYGYVEPGEKAAELLMEAAEEEIAQMERLLEQGEPEAATEVLLGILMAVDALGSSGTSPVLLEAGEGLGSVAFVAIQRWARAGGGPGVLTEILEVSPRWGPVVEQALARKR